MEPASLFKRFTPPPTEPAAVASEEALVTDARAGLTPAQMVERKLVSLLQSGPLPAGRPQSTAPRRVLS
jgi:hypothetical protein